MSHSAFSTKNNPISPLRVTRLQGYLDLRHILYDAPTLFSILSVGRLDILSCSFPPLLISGTASTIHLDLI